MGRSEIESPRARQGLFLDACWPSFKRRKLFRTVVGVRRDDPIFSRTAVGAGRGLHPGLARQRWHLSGVAHLAPQRRCSVRELSRAAVPEATSPMPTGNASTGGNYSGQQCVFTGMTTLRSSRPIGESAVPSMPAGNAAIRVEFPRTTVGAGRDLQRWTGTLLFSEKVEIPAFAGTTGLCGETRSGGKTRYSPNGYLRNTPQRGKVLLRVTRVAFRCPGDPRHVRPS